MYNVSLRINSLIQILRCFCWVQLTFASSYSPGEMRSTQKVLAALTALLGRVGALLGSPGLSSPHVYAIVLSPLPSRSLWIQEDNAAHACLPTDSAVLPGFQPACTGTPRPGSWVQATCATHQDLFCSSHAPKCGCLYYVLSRGRKMVFSCTIFKMCFTQPCPLLR